MTKSQLIKWSIARDALNFIGIGQIPVLCWLLDLPILVMHFNYAGAAALFTLLETIPIIGFFPFFTVAALCYSNHDEPEMTEEALLAPPPERVTVRRVDADSRVVTIESARALPEVDSEVTDVA